MAFDHGSHSLGIKNPFKLYGFVRSLSGAILAAIAVYYLWQSVILLKVDGIKGGVLLCFSLILLIGSIRSIGSGIFQLLRFFVGRSVPISLATNYCDTEKNSAKQERTITAYNEQSLKSMLMARKNVTFEEPDGWTSRLVHTLFPKLLFLPIPIRNLVQRFASAIFTSLSLISAFFISWLVISAGVAGSAGDIVLSLFSMMLIVYLAMSWFNLQRPLPRYAETKVENIGSGKFIFLICTAVILPIGLGALFNYGASVEREVAKALFELNLIVNDNFDGFSVWPLLGFLAICIVVTSIPLLVMIIERTKLVSAKTEVSEFRGHWQEGIHPKELFINMDNMILANRRYKEMPNRVYSEFTPEVNKQDDKGSFSGDLLIETQPAFKPFDQSSKFKNSKLFSLLLSQLFLIASGGVFIFLAFQLIDVYSNIVPMLDAEKARNLDDRNFAELFTPIANSIITLLSVFFIWRMLKSFGLSLELFSKVMFAELRFESLLMFFKCEGTYTESKLSTGMSIHDSTRSENTIVRTNFTPWLITSRVVTSTFAQEGAQNIEHARHIMEMHANKEEMDAVISEIKDFLSNRETMARVSSEKDLAGISTIHSINQQTRANNQQQAIENQSIKIEEAARFIQEAQQER